MQFWWSFLFSWCMFTWLCKINFAKNEQIKHQNDDNLGNGNSIVRLFIRVHCSLTLLPFPITNRKFLLWITLSYVILLLIISLIINSIINYIINYKDKNNTDYMMSKWRYKRYIREFLIIIRSNERRYYIYIYIYSWSGDNVISLCVEGRRWPILSLYWTKLGCWSH